MRARPVFRQRDGVQVYFGANMKASDALTTALFRDSRSAIGNATRTVPAFTDAVLEIYPSTGGTKAQSDGGGGGGP
eukprot:COSAG01_NODE_53023_length_342_cov_0.777778_2_plen_76_part_00